VGLDGRRTITTMLAQHTRTDSPNAGWTMSAAAGALGVTLEKRGVYSLAGGNAPLTAATVRWAVRLTDAAAVLIVWLAVTVAMIRKNIRGGKNG